MGELKLSPSEAIRVIKSWENCKEISGFQEQMGMSIVLNLFKMDPGAMKEMGFSSFHNLSGMQRMGVLAHGLNIMRVFDGLLMTALDPDSDDILPAIIHDVNQDRVLAAHFQMLCRAFLHALQEYLEKDEWRRELRSPWFTVMRHLSTSVVAAQ